jgi:hypothetical protein
MGSRNVYSVDMTLQTVKRIINYIKYNTDFRYGNSPKRDYRG